MPEIKSKMVPFYIEPTLYRLVRERIRGKYGSISRYIRSLVIRDLKEHGLLDNKLIGQLVVGSEDGLDDSKLPSVSTV